VTGSSCGAARFWLWSMIANSRLYTTRQVADETGESVELVRKWQQRTGRGTKLGRDWLFTDADLDAFRNRNTTPGRPKQEKEQEG
jgi:hypothetical protein